MPFISNLINRPVVDAEGEPVGTLKEIFARHQADIPYPKIVALEVKKGKNTLRIAIEDVNALIAPAISLHILAKDITPYSLDPEDIHLVRDVLDKQIIDTNGVRVVRVNDLELLRLENDIIVANVDIGSSGLIRRIGLHSMSKRLAERSRKGSPPGIISWEDVDLISMDQPIRLKVPGEKLADLHPADLAEILSHLSRQDGR
jgi:sporulation protein YlmC with PRC-barrel domain